MDKYTSLISKYINKTISDEDFLLLKKWISEDKTHLNIFKKELENHHRKHDFSFNAKKAYEKFLESTQKTVFKIRHYYKYAAILIIGFATVYGSFEYNKKTKNELVNTNQVTESLENNEAIVITLSDGSTHLITNNQQNTVVDESGNIIAQKHQDALTFNGGTSQGELAYNEILIPNGKTLKILLSDGTLVWLNAGTRFKFPQDFKYSSESRRVFLEGEAYFDVTKNEHKPFIVDNNGLDIKVVGTKFNVSSYSNDKDIATTLVEGSVIVEKDSQSNKTLQLVPGEQSIYNKKSLQISKRNVDTQIYTSWIDNKLVINNLRFNQILAKLERRFDVKIIDNSKVTDQAIYKGEFANEDLETILKTIAISNPFSYEIKDRNVTIFN